MSRHLLNEIEKLKTRILDLSTVVEEAVFRAVTAFQERDATAAQAVVDADTEIDLAEVDIEEECQKILALHQPVAHDLRFIIAILKINAELERIGDAAVNIAERVNLLAHEEQVRIPFDFLGMARKAQDMLRESLEALIKLDSRRAVQVIKEDDTVDQMNGQVYSIIEEGIRNDPCHVESYIHLLGVSRHIERIADHASNIAEDVIYLVEGRIVRHRTGICTNDEMPK